MILSKSECSLCKQILTSFDKIKIFSAFLPPNHRYGKFSDAAMHESCFLADPDHETINDMFYVFNKILASKPKDFKTVEEMDSWTKEAFQGWPPKNGVIIYEQCFTDDGKEAEWFWACKDMWEELEAAENAANKEFEERREEAYKQEREAWRYIRNDD